MKKIVSVVLAALMLFAALTVFASCGETTTAKAEESKTPATEQPTGETVPTTEEPTTKKLIMATNAAFPPYEFYDGDKIVGIDAEIAAKVAEKLGMELEIHDIEFDSIIAGIEAKTVDIGMAGMTVTEDRLKKVNFTESYAKGVQVVIVKEGSDITDIDGLAGKKIGVQQGTTGDIYATDAYGEGNVSKFMTGPDAVQALVSGTVDAVIIDNEPAKNFVKANQGLKILDTSYADEDYAIAIHKDNMELLESINEALAALKADGTIAAIVNKYIPADN